jgi:hypothetical protein
MARASLTLEQKVDLLIEWRKKVKVEIQDIWDRINGDSTAAAEFADETRDIAERARRLAQRVQKNLNEMGD